MDHHDEASDLQASERVLRGEKLRCPNCEAHALEDLKAHARTLARHGAQPTDGWPVDVAHEYQRTAWTSVMDKLALVQEVGGDADKLLSSLTDARDYLERVYEGLKCGCINCQ